MQADAAVKRHPVAHEGLVELLRTAEYAVSLLIVDAEAAVVGCALAVRCSRHTGALHGLSAVLKEDHSLLLDADVDVGQAVSQLKLRICREHRDENIILCHFDFTVQRLRRLARRLCALRRLG